MDLVKVANYLQEKAVELLREAERYQAIANDLITLTPGDVPAAVAVDKWKKSLENAPLPEVPKKKRRMSAAWRRAIKKAQKARWARIRQQNKVIQMKKRA